MSTEVVHGPRPVFTLPTSGEYVCTIVGHYTDRPGWAAAGVQSFRFQSDNPPKQVNELLALRSAFSDWWHARMAERGVETSPDGPYAFDTVLARKMHS